MRNLDLYSSVYADPSLIWLALIVAGAVFGPWICDRLHERERRRHPEYWK